MKIESWNSKYQITANWLSNHGRLWNYTFYRIF